MATWQTDADLVSSGALIGLDAKSSSPPTNAYIGLNDQLQAYIASSLSPAYIRIYARILLPDGSIVPNDWTITSFALRGGQIFPLQLAEGFLLSVTVYASNASQLGQTYVRLSLQRSGTVNYTAAQVLLAGYVGGDSLLSWPNSPLSPKTFGRGNMRVVSGTIPAPGVDISEQVPNNCTWRLVAFSFGLSTSGVVGNRNMLVVYDDGTTNYSAVPSSFNQAASQTTAYYVGTGYPFGSVDPVHVVLPGLIDHFMNTGFRIRTLSFGLQPTDQYFSVSYLVEEWLA